MKAFIITLIDNQNSNNYAHECLKSIKETDSNLEAEFFPAITPETMFDCVWRWPERKKIVCDQTGLTLIAYKNLDLKKRISCAQSHYQLWKLCVEINEPICVLEHDAYFIRQYKEFEFEGGALSINSPIKATFNDVEYDSKLIEGENAVPKVTDKNIPHGLPGNSAYIIKPWAAKTAMELQNSVGWWPNDAILCKQLCPWISAYKPYFTKVQNIKSTTSN